MILVFGYKMHTYPRYAQHLVLATGPGNPPAVRFLASGLVWFGSFVRGSPLIAVLIHVSEASTRDYHSEVGTIGHG